MVNWKTVLTCLVTAILLAMGGYVVDFQMLKAEVSNQKNDLSEIKTDIREIKTDVKSLLKKSN